MKRLLTLLVMMGYVFSINAQIAPNKYWVQFTDKNDSPYSINNPEEYLSERAIQRRQDYNIAIDNSAIKLFLKVGFYEEYRTDEIIMLKKEL